VAIVALVAAETRRARAPPVAAQLRKSARLTAV
jgi:hypothetical protein